MILVRYVAAFFLWGVSECVPEKLVFVVFTRAIFMQLLFLLHIACCILGNLSLLTEVGLLFFFMFGLEGSNRKG